jgi:hypothetical protein
MYKYVNCRLDEGIQQVEYIIMSIIAGRSTQYKLGTRNHDVRPRDIHSSTHDLDNVLRKVVVPIDMCRPDSLSLIFTTCFPSLYQK